MMDVEKALRRQANRADELDALNDKIDDTIREVRAWLLNFASHDFFRAQVTEEDLDTMKCLTRESAAALKKVADDLSKMDALLLEIARRG